MMDNKAHMVSILTMLDHRVRNKTWRQGTASMMPGCYCLALEAERCATAHEMRFSTMISLTDVAQALGFESLNHALEWNDKPGRHAYEVERRVRNSLGKLLSGETAR